MMVDIWNTQRAHYCLAGCEEYFIDSGEYLTDGEGNRLNNEKQYWRWKMSQWWCNFLTDSEKYLTEIISLVVKYVLSTMQDISVSDSKGYLTVH